MKAKFKSPFFNSLAESTKLRRRNPMHFTECRKATLHCVALGGLSLSRADFPEDSDEEYAHSLRKARANSWLD